MFVISWDRLELRELRLVHKEMINPYFGFSLCCVYLTCELECNVGCPGELAAGPCRDFLEKVHLKLLDRMRLHL
jgi:hypothetical protein